MSDSPENPQQPDPDSTAPEPSKSTTPTNETPEPVEPELTEPEPTSEAPAGLAPSPGLAPPTGIQQPADFQPPQGYAPPQDFQPPQGYPQPQGYAPPQAQSAPQGQVPPQGYAPQQGYAQQDPAAPQGFPEQQGQAAPQPPQRKGGLPTGAIIGIIAGAVVLLLLIVGGIFAIGSLFNRGPSGSVPTPEVGSSAATPAEAVEEYLQALADGDATTARTIAGGTSSDRLLSDEVLARSNELAPITNIEVDAEAVPQSDYDAVVSATFDIGDHTVQRDFRVWESYPSGWELSDGLMRMSVTTFDGLGLTMNGVDPVEDYVSFFPGAYEFELEMEEFRLNTEEDVFVLATDDDLSPMYELRPVLTDEATEIFRDLVRESLEECIAMTALTTPCGLDVSEELNDGSIPVPDTAQRTLTPEGDAALKKLEPTSSYEAPSLVSANDYIRITTTIEADRDGERVSGELLFGGDLRRPYVDFAEDQLEVVWQ
jgi:hypothetical protein